MVEVKIYPACLKCVNPRFKERNSETLYYPDHDEIIQRFSCDHQEVCKFIDGQEPISIEDKIADLVVDSEDATFAACSACKAYYLIIDYDIEHLDYCPRCGAKFERNMVREYLNGEHIETGEQCE